MAEATRERVQAAIDELGFVRNESARQLRQGRGRTFGLLLESMADPYLVDLARGAEAAMAADGLDTMWCTSEGSLARERRCLDFLEEQYVSGVVVTPVRPDAARMAERRGRGLAVVLLDRVAEGICSAGADHSAGGALGIRHLLDRRHRRLAYVTGRSRPGPVHERHVGAMRAARAAGLDERAVAVLEQPETTLAAGQAAARRLLALDPLPTGVFCASDLLAVGLLNELLRSGVKVPAEISVVGYEDLALAATAVVPLTTVRLPRRRLGRVAAELVMAESGDPEGHDHRQVVLNPELVVRESA